jgi:hypothetical protein
MRLLRLATRVIAALTAVALAAGCNAQAVRETAPGLDAPANAGTKPTARRCVAISVPALMNGKVSSTGTDACVVAGQTFTTILYEGDKIVDSQSGNCVSGCQEIVTYTCTKKKAARF